MNTSTCFDFHLTQTSDDASQAHQDVYGQDGPQPDNQASFSHELLAGAAGFEAMRKYQQHEEANGRLSHPLPKTPVLLCLASISEYMDQVTPVLTNPCQVQVLPKIIP